MAEVKLKFKIESDDDGYVSFECPYCESIFGLNVSEYKDNENESFELYCPYCGLIDKKDNFYTKEVVEQMQNLVINYMQEEINKAFGKMAKNVNSKYVKLTYKPLKNKKIKELRTENSTLDIFECKNCGHHVKVDYCMGKAKVYCAFCGMDIC